MLTMQNLAGLLSYWFFLFLLSPPPPYLQVLKGTDTNTHTHTHTHTHSFPTAQVSNPGFCTVFVSGPVLSACVCVCVCHSSEYTGAVWDGKDPWVCLLFMFFCVHFSAVLVLLNNHPGLKMPRAAVPPYVCCSSPLDLSALRPPPTVMLTFCWPSALRSRASSMKLALHIWYLYICFLICFIICVYMHIQIKKMK